jgi:hypothetical protein
MASHNADSDHSRQLANHSRRAFLLGVGAAAALTGCLSDSGSGDGTETEKETTGTETSEPNGGTTTSEPTDSRGDRDEGGQSLSRPEARELLPPESLAFRYEPPHGSSIAELWVAVVGEADAAAVRAESESGSYNEVSPQEGTVEPYLGVPVQVDTDGDEVTVFAVNDSGARGPVTSVRVPTDELTAEEARQAAPPEALSFTYEPPEVGDFGSLTIDVTADTDADTLVAQPQEAPGTFTDRVGNVADDETVTAGTTLNVAVDPEGDEVRIFASVDGATGEVTRWQGPE